MKTGTPGRGGCWVAEYNTDPELGMGLAFFPQGIMNVCYDMLDDNLEIRVN